jgi:hypothetical protein
MQPTGSYRPHVSRETRLLLTAALAAVAVLWLLARVRFRDRPSAPSPIPAVLSQIGAVPKLDDLASEVRQVRARLIPWLVPVGVTGAASSEAGWIAGLRVRDDAVLAVLGPQTTAAGRLLSADPASGLAVLNAPGPLPTPSLVPWSPPEAAGSRYLLATDASAAGVSLRPVFFGSLDAVETPLFAERLWAVPPSTGLSPGAILFTGEAALVGMVVAFEGRLLVVPAETLLAAADGLLARRKVPAGNVGLEVQRLTPSLAAAAGASAGVIVSWVDPAGPAAGRIAIGDVLEAFNGRRLSRPADWNVGVARLSAGDTVTLAVRRRGQVAETSLVVGARQPVAPSPVRGLGLTLRARAGVGAEVTSVQPHAAGERAGLAAGDVITFVGTVSAPTPAQVRSAFASLNEGQHVMVGVSRGDAHRVTTLER